MLLSFGGRGQYLTPATAEEPYFEAVATPWNNDKSFNTGTDVIMNDQGHLLQFSTSDGDQGGIYWKEFNGTNGGKSFKQWAIDNPQYPEIDGLKDPDIALTKHNGNVYAILVGISPMTNRVHYYNFSVICNPLNIEVTLLESTCSSVNPTNGLGFALEPGDERAPVTAFGNFVYWPLGSISGTKDFMFSRHCKSPNVDANENGDVVITWVEDAIVGTPFKATSDFADFMVLTSANLCIKWRQGNVMSAQGNISTQCYQGKCDYNREELTGKYLYRNGGTLGSIRSGSFFGDCIASKSERNFDNYFYQAADVAISQQPSSGKPVITYAYFRYSNTLVEPISDPHLITTQIPIGGCYYTGLNNNRGGITASYKDDWSSLYGDIPRVAATNNIGNNIRDYVVILSTSGAVYNCELETILAPGSVGLYWYHGTNWGLRRANNQSDVIVNPVANAAVAYNSGENRVTAIWDGDLGSTNGDREIVAKDYNFNSGGTLLNVNGTSYSIVNSTTDNSQLYPSIASRNTGTMRGYFWVDKDPSPNTFRGRLAAEVAGVDQLESASSTQMSGYCTFEVDPDAIRMGVYPNPSTNTQELIVKDADVQRVEIYGQLNQLILRSEVKDKKLVDGTSQKLAQGLYTVKFFTPTGTRISKLVIQ